ncbi:MAG: undecaprenyldiphospho-muramoylpentapeptide beta-N-acetylglucosaminyltransferase [Nitriliruptorales bacterium]|nr:undecaprenyldiphospho-muramoylpentapeptide beta-N-acetylglucosaminyltransferase [Nitriliruptorales bacterium]
MTRILLAGGGTGGHVFPGLAVAAALRDARADLEVSFVGTQRGLESRVVPEAGWPLHIIEVLPLARRLSPDTARVPVALLRAVVEVTHLIRKRRVVAAGVFGGYVSLPLALAARRTRIPYVVHEQNAIPGLANRLAIRRAAAVAVTFPSSVERIGGDVRVEVTGNPVRPELDAVDRTALRDTALKAFDLDPRRRTLLVFGGSQGAHRINHAVVAALTRWRDPASLQILHATGQDAYGDVVDAWGKAQQASLEAHPGRALPLVRCLDFVDRMDLAYAAADLVICRSGASTIAELTVLGVPSVLVPYPHATDDHQAANATDLAAAGGATVILDDDLNGETLVAVAEPLLVGESRRRRMAVAARRFGRPDAADRVAALVLDAAGLTPDPASRRKAPRPARARGPRTSHPTTREERRQ